MAILKWLARNSLCHKYISNHQGTQGYAWQGSLTVSVCILLHNTHVRNYRRQLHTWAGVSYHLSKASSHFWVNSWHSLRCGSGRPSICNFVAKCSLYNFHRQLYILVPFNKPPYLYLVSQKLDDFSCLALARFELAVDIWWSKPLIRNQCSSGNNHARHKLFAQNENDIKIVFAWLLRHSTFPTRCWRPACSWKACLNWTASQWGCVRPMRAKSPNICFSESIGWAPLWGG
jgi:hypothetical protein